LENRTNGHRNTLQFTFQPKGRFDQLADDARDFSTSLQPGFISNNQPGVNFRKHVPMK